MAEPFDTAAFIAAIDAVVYPTISAVCPTVRARAEQKRLLIPYNAEMEALEARWAAWLASEYLPGFPEAITDETFKLAWEKGYTHGYVCIEPHYKYIARYARMVKDNL